MPATPRKRSFALVAAAAGLGLVASPLALTSGALDVDDLLDRRVRVGLVPADREAALPAARTALSLLSVVEEPSR